MSLFEYRPPQATIRHRLRYNILPTDEERRRIAGSLSTARDRLLAIPGTGLASAHDASQDKALCDYISEYSSLIAPIRRLNDDVLALIFPVALVSEVVNFGRRRNVYSHPMTLTSISHYWRCVAIRTPEIWSRISVRWPSSGLHRLRECLRNSKDHGLSLDLDLTGRHTQMEVIDELIIHAERWVKLKLTIKDTETLHLLDPVRGRLSRLQQVVFDFDAASPPPAVAFDGFAIAPRLHTVQARLLRRLPCLPSLPFHQITQVAFVNSARPAVWDALQLFLSASCVDVSLDRGFREFFAPGAADPHTNVVVTELHIRDDVQQGPSLLPFITRSACPLRELVLQDTRVRVGELLALLRLTPTVEALVLTRLLPNSITDAVMSPLTPAPNNSDLLLPMLERITIAGTYLFSTNALLSMLERRSPTLVNVDIVLPDREIAAADRARFAALRSPSTKVSRLMCLDEMRSLVWVN